MISDLFNFGRPSGKLQIDQSLRRIFSERCGIFVLMQNKSDSLCRCFEGTFEPPPEAKHAGVTPEANYGLGCQVLKALGVGKIRLLTNSEQKFHGIRAYGLEVVERVPIG